MDSLPRVLLVPGLGALCAGNDVSAACIVRDIAEHTLAVKAQIAAMGIYSGMNEKDTFDMEYRVLQHSKLKGERSLPLAHQVALITGGAGAIGSGIAQELLEQGCHVAVTDLEGNALTALVDELKTAFGARVMGVPLDVTSPESVAEGFNAVSPIMGRHRPDYFKCRGGACFRHIRDEPGILSQAVQNKYRWNADYALRVNPPFQAPGHGRRYRDDFDQERICARRAIRRLQRHKGRRTSVGTHREPGIR